DTSEWRLAIDGSNDGSNLRHQRLRIAVDPDLHVAGDEVPRLIAHLIQRQPWILFQARTANVGDHADDLPRLPAVAHGLPDRIVPVPERPGRGLVQQDDGRAASDGIARLDEPSLEETGTECFEVSRAHGVDTDFVEHARIALHRETTGEHSAQQWPE